MHLHSLGTGVTVNSLHPGIVETELQRHIFGPEGSCCWSCLLKTLTFFKPFWTPDHGAQTSIYVAIAPELEGVSGKYFRFAGGFCFAFFNLRQFGQRTKNTERQ